jgi:hypothetical protein
MGLKSDPGVLVQHFGFFQCNLVLVEHSPPERVPALQVKLYVDWMDNERKGIHKLPRLFDHFSRARVKSGVEMSES